MRKAHVLVFRFKEKREKRNRSKLFTITIQAFEYWMTNVQLVGSAKKQLIHITSVVKRHYKKEKYGIIIEYEINNVELSGSI